jgi:hypothetical protein
METRPVDREIIGSLNGDPHGLVVWLIFKTRSQAANALAMISTLRQRAEGELVRSGFPRDALRTFRLEVTSVPEVVQGGGRFHFFR